MTDVGMKKGDVFPLSLNQLNIWALEQAVPGTSINNISATIRIKGRVNILLLKKALHLVLQSDASLRTRLQLRDGVPVQYYAEETEAAIDVLDFFMTDEESISNWSERFTQIPMPLIDAPLYRFVIFLIGENSAGLLVETHHLISDGWSQIMLCNRIGQTYLDLLSGKEPDATPQPDYIDYVEAERSYLSSDAYKEDERYWREILKTSGVPASLKSVRGAGISRVGLRRSYKLSQQLNHAITSFCMEHRVAPFAVFYMALATYLRRTGGEDHLTIGVPIFNRTNYSFKQTTGMFVSTLPFVYEMSDEWSFNSFSDHLMGKWINLLRHQRFPFSHIEALAGSGEPLFHLMLSYQGSQVLESQDASVSISGRWHYSGYQVEQLCIHLTNLEGNRAFSVDYDYLAQFFSGREIDELHQHLCQILTVALDNPDTPIRALPILSVQERERVLYTFNRTRVLRSNDSPYDMFAKQAACNPRRVALISGGMRITYETLRHEGERVAAALPEEGEVIAVLLPRDRRLFAAMVGIMQANCAWLLLPLDLPTQRILNILQQSGAARLISIPELTQPLGALDIPFLDYDSLPCDSAPVRRGHPDDLAYVVYTSGSTGQPKGVEIRQKSLLNLAMAMRPIYSKGGAVLSLCNVGFDAFLLESVVALLCGRTVLLTDEPQQENPTALARLIWEYGVGFLSTTPSRLSALMQNAEFTKALRRLESIVCGGEVFTGELLQRLKGYTDARIYNQYGPAETTVAVSCARVDCAERITIGRPMENCHLYVLDNELQPLPVHVYGELYIGGVCVGRGYRNAPELTESSFLPSPFEMGETLYKTGDLACWTEEGELLLAGRCDRQVKLRGMRVDPQEIAACLRGHPEVTDAVVRVWERDDNHLLVGYYVADQHIPEVELLTYAAAHLPRYMIPTNILQVESIPLSANGKVEEHLLPLPSQEEGRRPVENERQAQLLSVFQAVLKKPNLRVDSDYFLCGGNSLNAMETLGLIEERFGVRLLISDLYACRTAQRLEELLSLGQAEATTETISTAPARSTYPLSAMQKSIYVQSHMDASGFAYHMPGAFLMSERPDAVRLTDAFRAMIRDDVMFRTAFVPQEGEVVACVAEKVEFELPLLTAPDSEAAFAQFLQPFDLTRAPLIRAALWQDEEERWYLLVDLHHIISDGVSTPLLLDRLSTFYRGETPSAHLSYLDYAWYRDEHTPPEEEDNKDFWRRELEGYSGTLELPLDRPRPSVFDFCGDNERLILSEEVSRAIDRYCEMRELTTYMFLAGTFGLLLAELSGQEDVVIGTPISYRTRPELRDICGPLMGTMPLRLRPTGDLDTYFEQVKASTLGMIDHSDYPLEQILSLHNFPRTTAQNPLYQVLFQVRPLDTAGFRLDDIDLQYLPISTKTAKMDLSVEAVKQDGCYQFFIEYASSLFERETIAFFGRCFAYLLRQLVSDRPPATVQELRFLAPTDQRRFFDQPNRRVVPYLDLPVHCTIEEEAQDHPQATAVLWHDQVVTYGELEEQACLLAGLLVRHGVCPGDRVGLACRRSPTLLAALLGILKAGAVYVPFLSDYPPARIAYMMETADVRVILCDDQTAAELPEEACVRPVVRTNEPADSIEQTHIPPGTAPMYILFTSGSTGKPKGVQIPHRALANLLESMRVWMKGEEGPVLCITNVTFDIFITETLLALAQGFAVVLADEEEMLLPWRLAELIRAHQPRIAQFTPSRLQMCLSNNAFAQSVASLSFTIVAGEMVTSALVAKFKESCAGRLINMYGPTETAVYVTAAELAAGEPVTIGTPLDNCRIYVLDQELRPVLPTVRGELYVAGRCLADGYVARPDLTQAVFLPDPFFPGEKMYRSGDIGRLRSDGRIECFGRTDGQIKINGNRVELVEITEALLNAGAEQAVAVPVSNPDGSTTLYAVVTPETLQSPSLKEELERSLPSYMIPSRILTLHQMPYNASGKLDMLAIRDMFLGPDNAAPPTTYILDQNCSSDTSVAETLSEEDDEYASGHSSISTFEVEPNRETEHVSSQPPVPLSAALSGAKPVVTRVMDAEELLAIWRTILKNQNLSAEVSFFEQGGTSLSALSVLSEYFNRGISMTLADFYRIPTAQKQAQMLSAYASSSSLAADSAQMPSAPPAEVLNVTAQVPQVANKIQPALTTVLLTGATGFLGAHLLRSLLEHGTEKVICLLRGGRPDRLWETLSWYFGNGWTKRKGTRIEILEGDITQPNLGLPDAQYAALQAQVNAVFHAAADVRHYAADDALLVTNLEGTKQVIDFTRRANAALYHISTISVSGSHLQAMPQRTCIFTENDLDIGQNWADNFYTRSKFLAEREICQAIEQGLCARIFRIGRLVGRASDGVFQRNQASNAFYRAVRGISVLGALPAAMAMMPLELTPVDICAEAIVVLRNAPHTVSHIIEPNPAPMGETLAKVILGLQILSEAEFATLLSKRVSDGTSPEVDAVVELWNQFQSDVASIAVSTTLTQSSMAAAGFHWPDTDVRRVLDAFI